MLQRTILAICKYHICLTLLPSSYFTLAAGGAVIGSVTINGSVSYSRLVLSIESFNMWSKFFSVLHLVNHHLVGR